MTNSQIPSYSGVTINISNPTMNTGCVPTVGNNTNPQQPVQPAVIEAVPPQQQQIPQSYPPQYYLNNYNCPQNSPVESAPQIIQSAPGESAVNTNMPAVQDNQKQTEADLSKSTDIINKLDTQAAKEKDLEENGKQTRVVALTDEYIMSLENYLNNQNTEIRLMASKEVLTRLDEDKTRYDDPALNALLNKMLQDPQKLVRIAALSAFSSGLASGNDYTVQLLNNIQQNPNSDKDDVVDAANILLRMSADTKIQYTPQEQVNSKPEEQKA